MCTVYTCMYFFCLIGYSSHQRIFQMFNCLHVWWRECWDSSEETEQRLEEANQNQEKAARAKINIWKKTPDISWGKPDRNPLETMKPDADLRQPDTTTKKPGKCLRETDWRKKNRWNPEDSKTQPWGEKPKRKETKPLRYQIEYKKHLTKKTKKQILRKRDKA